MTDFFETRVENLEPMVDKKKSSAATKKSLKNPRRGKGKTPTPVSYSLAKNTPKLAIQARNTVNTVIEGTNAKIYVL